MDVGKKGIDTQLSKNPSTSNSNQNQMNSIMGSSEMNDELSPYSPPIAQIDTK